MFTMGSVEKLTLSFALEIGGVIVAASHKMWTSSEEQFSTDGVAYIRGTIAQKLVLGEASSVLSETSLTLRGIAILDDIGIPRNESRIRSLISRTSPKHILEGVLYQSSVMKRKHAALLVLNLSSETYEIELSDKFDKVKRESKGWMQNDDTGDYIFSWVSDAFKDKASLWDVDSITEKFSGKALLAKSDVPIDLTSCMTTAKNCSNTFT